MLSFDGKGIEGHSAYYKSVLLFPKNSLLEQMGGRRVRGNWLTCVHLEVAIRKEVVGW